MRIENILRDKVYIFSSSPQTTDTEKNILKTIAAKNNLGEISQTFVVDNNDDYDSYRIVSNKGQFLAKISLDALNKSLQKDFAALEELKFSGGFPIPIRLGEIKDYGANYSLSTWINKDNCASFGKSTLSQNEQGFLSFLNSLPENCQSLPSFSEKLADNYFGAESFLYSELRKADFGEDQEIIDLCFKETEETKNIIKNLYDASMEGSNFCHGEISPSRLLFHEGSFSMINFENSFRGNRLLDLLSLKYEFFLSEQMENHLLQEYKKTNNFSPAEFQKCSQIVRAMKFLALIEELIKQVYLYKGLRQRKLLELTEKMSRSFGYFYGFPPFERHRDKIGELFSHSVI